MNGSKNYLIYQEEVIKYRKNYFDILIEKYVNTDDPGSIIDIKTLDVVQYEGKKGKKAKKARIPYYGTLNSYSCKSAQQLIIQEISNLTSHTTNEKKFFAYAEQSFSESRNVENKDLSTSTVKFAICGKKISTAITVRKDPNFKRNLNFLRKYESLPIDDLSISSSRSFSEISNKEKKISTAISVQKDPNFKRNLNFLSMLKSLPIDDLSLSGRSFSEISNNGKKVSSSSDLNSDSDNYEELDSVYKQRKDTYPVKTNSNSVIACTNLTSKSITYIDKRQTPQNDSAEVVIRNSITSYASNKINTRSSILNSYTPNYKTLEYRSKLRSNKCSKFHYETLCIHTSKLRNPYYRKPLSCQYSYREDNEEINIVGKQKNYKCPAINDFYNNGLSIIDCASASSNNVHYVENLRQTCQEDSKKVVKNFFSRYTKEVDRNMVCNNNILKFPRVILTKLLYSKYA